MPRQLRRPRPAAALEVVAARTRVGIDVNFGDAAPRASRRARGRPSPSASRRRARRPRRRSGGALTLQNRGNVARAWLGRPLFFEELPALLGAVAGSPSFEISCRKAHGEAAGRRAYPS